MIDLIAPYAQGAVVALILSAAVRALPEPAPMGNAVYAWFYRFTHLVLANFDKAGKAGSVKGVGD